MRALVRSRLLALAWADVEALVHQDWLVARWLVRVLLEAQRAAQHHTARLVSHGVPGRLEAMLRELAEDGELWVAEVPSGHGGRCDVRWMTPPSASASAGRWCSTG